MDCVPSTKPASKIGFQNWFQNLDSKTGFQWTLKPVSKEELSSALPGQNVWEGDLGQKLSPPAGIMGWWSLVTIGDPHLPVGNQDATKPPGGLGS